LIDVAASIAIIERKNRAVSNASVLWRGTAGTVFLQRKFL